MRPDPGQAGFTLLEVIVALVIATLALSGLFAGAATGLRASHVSGDYMSALSRAQSHLAALAVVEPLVPGTQSGDDGGGFRWRMRIMPLSTIPLPARQNAIQIPGQIPGQVPGQGQGQGQDQGQPQGQPQTPAPAGPARPPPRLALMGIDVTVSWSTDGGTRQVALRTQRLSVIAPASP
jgi:prepilin-type N-terminal cleavage/methylation domain-containing protein